MTTATATAFTAKIPVGYYDHIHPFEGITSTARNSRSVTITGDVDAFEALRLEAFNDHENPMYDPAARDIARRALEAVTAAVLAATTAPAPKAKAKAKAAKADPESKAATGPRRPRFVATDIQVKAAAKAATDEPTPVAGHTVVRYSAPFGSVHSAWGSAYRYNVVNTKEGRTYRAVGPIVGDDGKATFYVEAVTPV